MSDYEFKNSALAKLYKTFMNNGPWSTVKCVDGMLEAFKECDKKLADIQDQCEHWKTMYGNACGDQDVLKESIRLLDTENRRLRQKVSDQEKEINQRRKEADGLYKELDRLQEENESLKQKVREQEKEIEDLKKRCEDLRKRHLDVVTVNNKTIDQLREDNESLHHVIDDFVTKVDELTKKRDQLQEENETLKNSGDTWDSGYLKNSRDTWRTRAKHAEAEVEELKKALDLLQSAYNGACKDRDHKAEVAVKLAKKRDELQEENDQLREENEGLKKKLTETTDILEKINRDRNDWRRRALMTKLTSKLPDVKEEYTMTFTMDKADYKELMNILSSKAFGASPEYTKTFLHGFCGEHGLCNDCPLREIKHCNFDTMSDEEIENCYKIAISSK